MKLARVLLYTLLRHKNIRTSFVSVSKFIFSSHILSFAIWLKYLVLHSVIIITKQSHREMSFLCKLQMKVVYWINFLMALGKIFFFFYISHIFYTLFVLLRFMLAIVPNNSFSIFPKIYLLASKTEHYQLKKTVIINGYKLLHKMVSIHITRLLYCWDSLYTKINLSMIRLILVLPVASTHKQNT